MKKHNYICNYYRFFGLILVLNPKTTKETIIQTQSTVQTEEQKQPLAVPEKYSIEVPFTSQSPFATWDEDENSGCEEASLIMVWHWLQGDVIGKISPAQAEQEIRKLIAFENENMVTLLIPLQKILLKLLLTTTRT